MAGFLSKMFPSLFGDPAEEAMERKMRINSTLRRFDQEVKKQDNFIKQYLMQATVHKRTGDSAALAQAKKMLAFSFAYRKRAQHTLNSLRLFSTMADQMEAYKDFCGAVNDISMTMGNAISTKDVMNAQMQLQKGMEKAKSTGELMDQILTAFDSSFAELEPSELENAGLKEDDLDKIINEMADKKDSLTEDTISKLINTTTN
ncbi:MAG: hypothetical protein IJS08_17300 [Victivallales bacterium]|nr:hypothetical protein [Victivallales bacterium]